MQLVIALMPSLMALPMASSFPQPPTNGGAGKPDFEPPQLPPDPFPSTLGWPMVEWNHLFYKPPAPKAVQAEEVVQPLEEAPSSDDEPPGLEPVPSSDKDKKTATPPPQAVVWLPYIDMVMPHVGLLTLSMDQMHAVLDTHPQLFASMWARPLRWMDRERMPLRMKRRVETPVPLCNYCAPPSGSSLSSLPRMRTL